VACDDAPISSCNELSPPPFYVEIFFTKTQKKIKASQFIHSWTTHSLELAKVICMHYSHVLCNVELIQYQFWCTRCAFWLLKSLQWCSCQNSWRSEKKRENCERADKTQTEYHEMQPNLSKDRAMHVAWISFCINEINFSNVYNEYIFHSMSITDSGMHSITIYVTGVASNWNEGVYKFSL
jgi:hypothetical protein